MAFVFALFLGVYGSAVIKGAALLLAEILPVPVWALIWLVAIIVGLTVFIGGLRGVLYTEAMQGVVMLVGMLMLVGAIFFQGRRPVGRYAGAWRPFPPAISPTTGSSPCPAGNGGCSSSRWSS